MAALGYLVEGVVSLIGVVVVLISSFQNIFLVLVEIAALSLYPNHQSFIGNTTSGAPNGSPASTIQYK